MLHKIWTMQVQVLLKIQKAKNRCYKNIFKKTNNNNPKQGGSETKLLWGKYDCGKLFFHFLWYASLCSAWYFCFRKSDIVTSSQWYSIRHQHSQSEYHSAESRISLRSNRTRRKANRTEKSTCYCKCFFIGGGGGNRNRVRKSLPATFYERIRYINIPSAKSLTTGVWFW